MRAHMQAVDPGAESHCCTVCRLPHQCADAGTAAGGRLAWRPETLSREVATAVSAQVSIAVARSIAIEASARMEAAREGERLRTALIDSLTHELRTPLTSIRAAATTLLEGEGLDEAGRLDMVRDHRRGSVAARSADRRSRGDGRDRRQRGAGEDVVRSIPARLLDQAVEESRKILAAHKVTISSDREDAERRRPAGLVRSASAGPGSAPPAGERGQLYAARQPRHAEQPAHGRPAGVLVWKTTAPASMPPTCR